jgi:colanic acid/amylovoran biosynthesis glycosyltransferase
MKIGIYSGDIPSSVFIEQMLYGISSKENLVFIYGSLKGNIDHYNNSFIKPQIFPNNKLMIVLIAIKLIIRLFFNKKYDVLKILKPIFISSNNWRSFFIRCNRILPPFFDNLDILHFQWAKSMVYYPEIINFINCKIVLSLRGTHINISPIADKNLSMLYRKYFPLVDKFHAVSKSLAINASKYGAEMSKISIVYSSVKQSLLDKNKYNNISRKLSIVSVGRFHWVKGYRYALEAMSMLKKNKVDFIYTIFSSDSITEDMICQINDLNLEKYVKIVYGLPQKRIVSELPNFNLFVLPSVQEGVSNAVLEAMAMRIPVISTNCGGMEEVIIHNKNGFITPNRDAKSLALQIENIIDMDKNTLMEIINEAEKTIRYNHLLDNQISKMLKVYENLIVN